MKNIRLDFIKEAFLEFKHSPRRLNWIRLKIVMLSSKLGVLKNEPSVRGYLGMQRRQYQLAAAVAKIEPGKISGDCVAAVDWDLHNNYADYASYILKYVPRNSALNALEYGCGPGRNILNWSDRFRRIDGVDISAQNLINAKEMTQLLPADKKPHLYLTLGYDTGEAPKNSYDFAFSVICLQHICVYDIRKSIFAAIFECLKGGGRFAFQMGFNRDSAIPGTVAYYDNFFEAAVTNGGSDVCVTNANQLELDLIKIGFQDFEFEIRPAITAVSGVFKEWIFVNVKKPE